MKKIRHWLHILLVLITCGVWLPVYLIIVSTTEMYNRGYRAAQADNFRNSGTYKLVWTERDFNDAPRP